MAAKDAIPAMDQPAQAAGTDAPDAARPGVSGEPAVRPGAASDPTHANGLTALDDLLTTLDSPELASVRGLFNMC
jgi:hypothetical protein